MKRLIFSALTLLALLSGQSVLAASSADLKLEILPIDCVFEIVQDGLNTITYLTPVECGKYVPPPAADQSGSPINTASRPVQVSSNGTIVPLFHDLPNQTPAQPLTSQKPSTTASVKQPAASVTPGGLTLTHALTITGGIIASGAVLFGLYQVLLFLLPK